MNRRTRLSVLLLVLLACGGCDQGTKELARSMLRSGPSMSWLHGMVQLEYAENRGAFLSAGAGLPEPFRTGLFTFGVALMLVGLLAWALLKRRVGPMEMWSVALVLTGGLSNWGDRLVRDGRVVDFMVLGIGPLHTGIFNVADVAIMVGLGLLLWSAGRNRPVAQDTSG
jgi:signal peptidase II